MFLATCGPALAGIIVTCISGTNRTPAKKRLSWLAFLISWTVVTLMGTVASANTVVVFIQPLEQNVMIIVFFVFTVAIVMADRMWKRLPEAHPAVQGA